MHIFIDVLLVLLFAGTVINYFRMGFVKSLFSLCKFALSLLLAFSLSATVGALISEKFVYEPIYEAVHGKIDEVASDVNEDLDMSELVDKLPGTVQSLIESSGQDLDEIKSELGEDKVSAESVDNLSAEIATGASGVISNVIAFIIIFIVAMIILSIVAVVLDKVCQLPLLRQFNKVFGLLLGIVCGVLQLVVACTIITAILNLIGVNSPEMTVSAMNEKTVLYSFFNNSGITQWIFSIFSNI